MEGLKRTYQDINNFESSELQNSRDTIQRGQCIFTLTSEIHRQSKGAAKTSNIENREIHYA